MPERTVNISDWLETHLVNGSHAKIVLLFKKVKPITRKQQKMTHGRYDFTDRSFCLLVRLAVGDRTCFVNWGQPPILHQEHWTELICLWQNCTQVDHLWRIPTTCCSANQAASLGKTVVSKMFKKNSCGPILRNYTNWICLASANFLCLLFLTRSFLWPSSGKCSSWRIL